MFTIGAGGFLDCSLAHADLNRNSPSRPVIHADTCFCILQCFVEHYHLFIPAARESIGCIQLASLNSECQRELLDVLIIFDGLAVLRNNFHSHR